MAALIAAVYLFSPSDEVESNPEHPLQVIDIQGPKTEAPRLPRELPAIAKPKAQKDPINPAPSEPLPVAELAVMPGTSGSDVLIWTPPPPVPMAGPAGSPDGIAEARVYVPEVTMGNGPAEAVLLSFDSAKLSDQASRDEARRLSGSGLMVMTVDVDETGRPSSCAVTTSTGSALLDGKGCDLVMTYRYRPARGVGGRPVASSVIESIEFLRDDVERADGSTIEAGSIVRGSGQVDPGESLISTEEVSPG